MSEVEIKIFQALLSVGEHKHKLVIFEEKNDLEKFRSSQYLNSYNLLEDFGRIVVCKKVPLSSQVVMKKDTLLT